MTLSTDTLAAVTGVVLAGGRGARVGGRDKGLIEYRGQPLAAQALAALQPQCSALMISANRHLDRYRELCDAVVHDETDDFSGPLAGMLAALKGTQTPWIACLPCDSVAVPEDLVPRLLGAATAARARAAYAVDRSGPQYAVCVLHRACERELEETLQAQRHAVRDFLSTENAIAVPFPDATFGNLNTPEALAC